MRLRLNLKKLSLLILIIYLIFTSYGAYVLLSQKFGDAAKSKHENKEAAVGLQSFKTPFSSFDGRSARIKETTRKLNRTELPEIPDSGGKKHEVEIWSKAGIGQYTWEHILGASLEPRLGGVWNYGFKKIGRLELTFRTGHGVLPNKVPTEVENLLLVLNGRSLENVARARTWLDNLHVFSRLRNAALMLIGSEQCENDWVLPYMQSRGGPLRFLLIVYDSPLVNNKEIYQWPLGVATYRGFPVVDSSSLNLKASRPYRCNFIGTVYPNSSRELLLDVIRKHNLDDYCYVKTRQSWMPSEKEETRLEYEKILSQSDLTLNPVGMNTECYRIYEACSYGSVPVIEYKQTLGNCANQSLRLLKRYKAPFIFLDDWNRLPKLLREEARKTPSEIAWRRENLIQWYYNFRVELKRVFLKTIEESFFL